MMNAHAHPLVQILGRSQNRGDADAGDAHGAARPRRHVQGSLAGAVAPLLLLKSGLPLRLGDAPQRGVAAFGGGGKRGGDAFQKTVEEKTPHA